MTTWTEIVAVAVVHSSTAALSHFGVMLEPVPAVQTTAAPAPSAAATERVIARSPRAPEKLVSCPKPRTSAGALHA